jgi:hypothetical protein
MEASRFTSKTRAEGAIIFRGLLGRTAKMAVDAIQFDSGDYF